MDKTVVLKKLRDAIPEMECIPGCTACCGHVPWAYYEWDQLSDADKIQQNKFTLKCPFAHGGQCNCYDDRPITCRIYGVTEGLPCCRGVIAPRVLTVEEITALMKEYDKTFFEGEQP